MSKFTDRLVAELLFREKPKEKKVKKDLSFKDWIKFEKEFEEYKEWKKSKEPKKEEKKGWEKLSVLQKLTILMITVPFGLMIEMMVLLKFATILGSMVR